MTKINVITAPDILYNQSLSFLLVHPSIDVKGQFSNLLQNFVIPTNVYLFEDTEDGDTPIDYNWLFQVSSQVDYIVVDVDNCNVLTKNLIGYFLSLPKTFYLTNDEETPYNKISINRIYNLDWLYDEIVKEPNEENA